MDEVVYRVSPSLATATYKANLSQPAQNTIEQYSHLFSKHRELLNQDPIDAWDEYQKLDPQIQGALSSVFGITDYSKKPVDWTLSEKIWKGVTSPFRGLFGAAVAYNRTLNAPGAAFQQQVQGEESVEFFNRKTWQHGWDGTNMFDVVEVQRLDNNYGRTLGVLARGLAEGRTPGEIVAAEGGITEEFVRALDLMFTQPEVFEPILKEYKRAQLSPGRTLARAILGNRTTDSSFYTTAFNVLSGVSDAAYQIAIDPLTYVTFGVAPAITKGARLAQLIREGKTSVPKIFNDPEVAKYWDDFGAVLESYKKAKDPVQKGAIRQRIADEFAEYDNQSAITLLSSSGVKDSTTAREFFEKMEDFNLLFSGRVFNTDKFRGQNVAAATRTRAAKQLLTSKITQFWDNATSREALTESNKQIFAEDIISTLSNIGEDVAVASAKAEGLIGTGALAVAEESLQGVRKLTNKLRIHPGGRGIYIDDARVDETLDVVESLASLTMDKPLARIFAQTFRELPSVGDRVVVLRGLYAYTMQRMGIGAREGGEAYIARQLEEKFGNTTGFLIKQDALFAEQFVPSLTKIQRTTEEATQVPMRFLGAPHFYQETNTIGQLNWTEIAQWNANQIAKSGLGKKTEALRNLGAITNSKLSQGTTDNWTFFTLIPKLGIKSALDEQMFFLLFAQKEELFNYLAGRGRQAATILGTAAKGPNKFISFVRDKIKNYSGAITDEARMFDMQNATSVEDGFRQIGIRAAGVVREKTAVRTLNDSQESDVIDLIEFNSNSANAVTSTVASRSGLGGLELGGPTLNIDPTDTLNLKIVEEFGKNTVIGRTFVTTNENLNLRQRGVAQFREVRRRFAYNDFRMGKKTVWSPGESFFKFNGLRTADDVTQALEDGMIKAGFIRNVDGNWQVDPKQVRKVENFLYGSGDTAVKIKQGFTEPEIAQERILTILGDLYNGFNGGSEKAFNQQLWNLITAKTKSKAKGPSTKAITATIGRKGTPLGDAKDIAMRSESDAAIVELQDVARQAEIKVSEPEALGKSSSETSLLRLGPVTDSVAGKTIMLARNGKLSGQPLRTETIASIQAAHKAGAKFVVGDMPGVDDVFYKVLDDLGAEYTVFHTGANPRTTISKGTPKPGDPLKKIWKDLDFEDWFTSSQDNLISGPFKTDIEFAGADSISSFAKGKEWMWEKMDRQVTAWHRTPAFTSMYLAKRDIYRQAQNDYAQEILRLNPDIGPKQAERMARKRYTEIAGQESTYELLRFVDDPSIRSQLAWSARNVGRFYRATEDFIRRIYRLRKASLNVIYRLRLSSLGLEGSGFIHQDQQGEKYVVMPMDDLIFQAVNSAFTAISGGRQGYLEPNFNDFTLKLAFANPGLSPDAAKPTLSGPIAGASVWLFKSLIGSLPNNVGDVAADQMDNLLLGDIGDNLTLRRALVPVTLDRLYRIFSSDEKDKQEVTAIHQAIAYNQAYGKPLPVNATPEERYEYIKNLRITAHNVVALRNILGLTPIPFTVGTQDSQEVPDYLKQVGIGAIRQEFFDLYENLQAAPNPRQDDLYEETLAAFVGSNPNRLVYTVSRQDKVRKIAFQKTDEVKNWLLKNQDLVKKYGDVAFLAAPSVGEFSPAAYAWFEAAELIQSRDLESYLLEVQISVDRQKYFDAEDRAMEQIQQTADPGQQALIREQARRYRDSLRISNPLLDYALQQGDFGISTQERMMVDLKQMLQDPDVNLSALSRDKLNAAVEITNEAMRYFEFQNNSGNRNYVQDKKVYRNNALVSLNRLADGDPTFAQAKRVIFEPMLRFKSRDVL